MSTTPVITIFVRHSADCDYKDDETYRRCKCRKHLRWTRDGKQYRQKANTRSWGEAERVKRELEDELSGSPAQASHPSAPSHPSSLPPSATPLAEAIKIFIQDKKLHVSEDVVKKYTRLLGRLTAYCEAEDVKVSTVGGLNAKVTTGFCSTWDELYPSGNTRAKLRERLRTFLRYCYDERWLDRIPRVPQFKVEETETQPLTPEEYERLLSGVREAIKKGDPRRKTQSNSGQRSPDEEERQVTNVRAFLECMRWTGLAIGDTMRLKRSALAFDERNGLWKVTTKRKKTGVPVSNPIPEHVARALLKVENSNPVYFFWSGEGKVQSATSNWGQRYIAPTFKAAGIETEGHMLSHRLRDTFAVHLLENGVPMEEVSRLLGHTSIRVTEKHYAKWSRGRQDRLDGLVSGTWVTPKGRGRPGRKQQA
jgi:integrase